MLKNLPVIAAFLLLLSSTHAMALEGLEKPEGKAGEANGFKNAATLSIAGTKFEDSNRNTIFDDGERGLSGWVIRLKLNDREISNTTTDASGRYSFTNLGHGNYNVTEDQQAGWAQSFPGSGYYNIYLSDRSAYGYDFGNFRLSNASRAPVGLSSVPVRPFRAFDEYGNGTYTYTDENGNVQVITVNRVIPKMIEEDGEIYERNLRPRRDANPDTQGFSHG